MKIFLTFRLAVSEPCFDELTEVLKVESHHLLRNYSYDPMTHGNDQWLAFIVDGISRSTSDILVGSAGSSWEDFQQIAAALARQSKVVDAIFIPSASRRLDDLKAGQEMVRLHNRWIDFYPGQVEEVHEERERRIKQIVEGFVGSATKVIEK